METIFNFTLFIFCFEAINIMKILTLCEFFDETLEYQENLLVVYYRKYGREVTVITSTLDSVFDYYSDKHDVKKTTREYRLNGARIIKLQC